jgi:phage repressor protein C with HTH and peptisase S24 domain
MKQDDFEIIWHRVKQITGWKKQNDLGNFLGIKSGSISSAKALGIFREPWAKKIAAEFNTTVEEILYSTVDTVLIPDSIPSVDTSCTIPQWQQPDPGMFCYVPLATAKLSAGGGAFVLSEDMSDYYAFRKSWLNRVATSPKNVVLMGVQGDSMSPTVLDKDTVMIDIGRTEIIEGMIYAIRLNHTIMLKRLTHRPGGIINVISDNKEEFEPYQAHRKNIHVIGQIIYFSRDLVSGT